MLCVACSRRGKFTVVPILVGSLANDKEQLYGELLAPYLADPDNLFVISSDFCHWGSIVKYYEQIVSFSVSFAQAYTTPVVIVFVVVVFCE